MDIPREIEGARVPRAANLNDATAPGGRARYSGGELQAGGPRFDRHPSIGESDDVVGPVASHRLKRLACEMLRAAASAMAQRLWLTTSTLCPSGSRTNAP